MTERKLVPLDPTPDMHEAAIGAYRENPVAPVYYAVKAAIAAAPIEPEQNAAPDGVTLSEGAIKLSRNELHRLLPSFVSDTDNLCRQALAAIRLTSENESLRAERDLHYNRLAGILFSGRLDSLTGKEARQFEAEYVDAKKQVEELELRPIACRALEQDEVGAPCSYLRDMTARAEAAERELTKLKTEKRIHSDEVAKELGKDYVSDMRNAAEAAFNYDGGAVRGWTFLFHEAATKLEQTLLKLRAAQEELAVVKKQSDNSLQSWLIAEKELQDEIARYRDAKIPEEPHRKSAQGWALDCPWWYADKLRAYAARMHVERDETIDRCANIPLEYHRRARIWDGMNSLAFSIYKDIRALKGEP